MTAYLIFKISHISQLPSRHPTYPADTGTFHPSASARRPPPPPRPISPLPILLLPILLRFLFRPLIKQLSSSNMAPSAHIPSHDHDHLHYTSSLPLSSPPPPHSPSCTPAHPDIDPDTDAPRRQLAHALRTADFTTATTLVSRHAFTPVITSPLTTSGLTALHLASLLGAHQLVHTLLVCGAIVDHDALLFAARHRHPTVVHTLLHASPASVRAQSGPIVLLEAAYAACGSSVLALLRAGVPPTARRQSDGATALHLAAIARNVPMVTALLYAGASPYARCARGTRPIDWARKVKDVETIAVLTTAMITASASPSLNPAGSLQSKQEKKIDVTTNPTLGSDSPRGVVTASPSPHAWSPT